jgi:hypothetical protein
MDIENENNIENKNKNDVDLTAQQKGENRGNTGDEEEEEVEGDDNENDNNNNNNNNDGEATEIVTARQEAVEDEEDIRSSTEYHSEDNRICSKGGPLVNDFEDANYVTTSANDGYGNNVVDISVDHIISKVTIIKKTATKTKNVEARDYVLAKFGVK